MVISNILGGLGNQMFQYAVGRALAHRRGDELKLDISEFESYTLRQFELDVFNVKAAIASPSEIERLKYQKPALALRILSYIFRKDSAYGRHYYREKFYQFDPDVLTLQGDVYLFGYWQTEKYFSDYEQGLRQEFTLKTPLSRESEYFKNQILAEEHAVALHIRRGDYVTNATTNSYHGLCSLEYYKEAVTYIEQHVTSPHFFIFSDDLAWAKEHLDFIGEVTFVELSDAPDHEEMYLMSQCHHNIIANSSFSWWGAWLNENRKKIVIAPKQWFTDASINTDDLISEGWIRL